MPSAVRGMRCPQPVSKAACASIPKGLTPSALAARWIVGRTSLTNWVALCSMLVEGDALEVAAGNGGAAPPAAGAPAAGALAAAPPAAAP